MEAALPALLFLLVGFLLSSAMVIAGSLFGPRRRSGAKDMPYESGMDPFHDTQRRFDVRFHLVAIAFLVFDVEILFLYPWAVAMNHPDGVDAWVKTQAAAADAAAEPTIGRWVIFGGALFFFALLALGWFYDWKKGVYQWR